MVFSSILSVFLVSCVALSFKSPFLIFTFFFILRLWAPTSPKPSLLWCFRCSCFVLVLFFLIMLCFCLFCCWSVSVFLGLLFSCCFAFVSYCLFCMCWSVFVVFVVFCCFVLFFWGLLLFCSLCLLVGSRCCSCFVFWVCFSLCLFIVSLCLFLSVSYENHCFPGNSSVFGLMFT